MRYLPYLPRALGAVTLTYGASAVCGGAAHGAPDAQSPGWA